jgi:hypothetical protein
MFLYKFSSNDFYDSVEKKLRDIKQEKVSCVNSKCKIHTSDYLDKAAELLEKSGFKVEAKMTRMVSKRVKDPASKGLTARRMLWNLANVGWQFNPPKGWKKNINAAEDEPANPQESQKPQDFLETLEAYMRRVAGYIYRYKKEGKELSDEALIAFLSRVGFDKDQAYIILSSAKMLLEEMERIPEEFHDEVII